MTRAVTVLVSERVERRDGTPVTVVSLHAPTGELLLEFDPTYNWNAHCCLSRPVAKWPTTTSFTVQENTR